MPVDLARYSKHSGDRDHGSRSIGCWGYSPVSGIGTRITKRSGSTWNEAGYGENELAKLEAVGTNLDFYIGYGMEPENSTPNGAFTFLGIFESSGWADTLGPRSRRRLPSCSVESCRRPAAIEAATDD